jgi:hypothetical protein
VRQRRELAPKTQAWFRSALPWLPPLGVARTMEKQ